MLTIKPILSGSYLRRRGADAVIGPYNSAVGVINLPWYVDKKILPVHLTSTYQTECRTDGATGLGNPIRLHRIGLV